MIDKAGLDKRAAAARAHPMFARIKKLAPKRLLVTIPQPIQGSEAQPWKTDSVIIAPTYNERNRRLYGEMCEVLAVGDDCAPELVPGARIFVNEFSGTCLVDSESDDRQETPLAIIGDGDVMAVFK